VRYQKASFIDHFHQICKTLISDATAIISDRAFPRLTTSMIANRFNHVDIRMLIPIFVCYLLNPVEGGTVTSISFSMPDQQCFVGNKAASIVVKFTPAATLPTGGFITFSYPTDFFASIAPVVINAGGVIVSAGAPDPTTNVILLTVTAGSIPAFVQFTMTLSGLSINKIPSGSVEPIRVTTSTDSGLPQGVSTGARECRCYSLKLCPIYFHRKLF
jgi:hypothetical protein